MVMAAGIRKKADIRRLSDGTKETKLKVVSVRALGVSGRADSVSRNRKGRQMDAEDSQCLRYQVANSRWIFLQYRSKWKL